jgi:hypothetical protein
LAVPPQQPRSGMWTPPLLRTYYREKVQNQLSMPPSRLITIQQEPPIRRSGQAERHRFCQRKLPFPLAGRVCPSRSKPERGITMVQDDCAQGAPRGRFAHSPTGFRRMTRGLLKADRSAEGFAGLPEGVESAGQLLAALKATAPRLGVSPRLVHAVDWLFCFSQPQDWEQGGQK